MKEFLTKICDSCKKEFPVDQWVLTRSPNSQAVCPTNIGGCGTSHVIPSQSSSLHYADFKLV